MRIDGVIIDPRISSIFDMVTKIRGIGKSFIGIGILGIMTFLIIFQLNIIGVVLNISSLLMIVIGLLVSKKSRFRYLLFYIVYLVTGTIILTVYFILSKNEYVFMGYIIFIPLMFRCVKVYYKGMKIEITDDKYELYFKILNKFKDEELKKEIIKFTSYTSIKTNNILCLPYNRGFIITTKKRDMLEIINKSKFKIIKHNNGKKLIRGKYQFNDNIEKFEMKRKEFDKLNKILYDYNNAVAN